MHACNVALILNLSSEHVLSQFRVVFDDEFSSTLRSNKVLPKWADLASRSTESTSNCDIDSSKIWFNQHYDDPKQSDSRFDATFMVSNSNPRPASSLALKDNANSSISLLTNE